LAKSFTYIYISVVHFINYILHLRMALLCIVIMRAHTCVVAMEKCLVTGRNMMLITIIPYKAIFDFCQNCRTSSTIYERNKIRQFYDEPKNIILLNIH